MKSFKFFQMHPPPKTNESLKINGCFKWFIAFWVIFSFFGGTKKPSFLVRCSNPRYSWQAFTCPVTHKVKNPSIQRSHSKTSWVWYKYSTHALIVTLRKKYICIICYIGKCYLHGTNKWTKRTEVHVAGNKLKCWFDMSRGYRNGTGVIIITNPNFIHYYSQEIRQTYHIFASSLIPPKWYLYSKLYSTLYTRKLHTFGLNRWTSIHVTINGKLELYINWCLLFLL